MSILHKYENFQLWESPIKGLLLEKSKNFLSFSKNGINILSLGSIAKQAITECTGHRKILHSLDSLSFLKIDPYNYLNFQCQDYNNRVISVE